MKIRTLISFTILSVMLFQRAFVYAAKGSPTDVPCPYTVSIASTSSVYVDEAVHPQRTTTYCLSNSWWWAGMNSDTNGNRLSVPSD